MARTLVLAAGLLAASGQMAYGQTYIGRESPHGGSIEVSGGATWAGGFDLDSENAELGRATGTDPYVLFTTDGRVSGFPGVHGRLGIYLTPSVSVEGGVRFTKPRLSFDLADDVESAENETASQTLSQWVIDGSVLFHFTNASFAGGRGVPFVSAGGGYVRELHEGEELVETGNEFHATFGLKYWFGSAPRRFGVRGEFGFSSRQGGFDSADSRRTLPLGMASLTYLF